MPIEQPRSAPREQRSISRLLKLASDSSEEGVLSVESIEEIDAVLILMERLAPMLAGCVAGAELTALRRALLERGVKLATKYAQEANTGTKLAPDAILARSGYAAALALEQYRTMLVTLTNRLAR